MQHIFLKCWFGGQTLKLVVRSGSRPAWDTAVTHSNGLVQRLLVLPLELGSDPHQVHFAAGHQDPGHHLLLGSFTLKGQTAGQNPTTDQNQGPETQPEAHGGSGYLHGFVEFVGKVQLPVLEALH